MSDPVISVIIPVFNGASEVSRAIESALAQTYGRVEVIVVNDGSTDQTREVLDQFGDRIRAIHQSNGGLAAARNAGILAATGEWVAFLDHDDSWQPEKLIRQMQRARETGFEIVYSNAVNFGDVNRVAHLRSDPDQMAEGDLFQALLLDNFIVVSSVMLQKHLLLEAGTFDTALGVVEDWDLWLKLAARGARFAAVREPVTLYQWRPGSLSKNYDRMRNTRLQIIQRALASDRGQRSSWAVRRRALAGVESCSAWFLAAASPKKALPWYLSSLRYWPFDLTVWKGVVKSCLGRS